MAEWWYNDPAYRAFRRHLATHEVPCWYGCGRRAVTPDHDPPVSMHTHHRGGRCCTLRPSCATCSHRQGAQITNGTYLTDTRPLTEWFD